MLNRENLKQFPEILGKILQESGDERGWLINEILEQLSKNSLNPDFNKNKSIQNIQEYCIEEISKKQASCFYEYFKIQSIKDVLIQDFIKMEHERRRDDFESFCLCTFQQIENVTNILFSENLKLKIKQNRKKKAYKYLKNPDTIEQMLFEDKVKLDTDYDSKFTEKFCWSFRSKFKAILYYFYFNEDIYNSYDLNTLFNIGNQLYQVRNKNHRGSVASDYQNRVLNEINHNKDIYYLRFMGFLENFIFTVNKNIELPE
jgi:hypothetical protein